MVVCYCLLANKKAKCSAEKHLAMYAEGFLIAYCESKNEFRWFDFFRQPKYRKWNDENSKKSDARKAEKSLEISAFLVLRTCIFFGCGCCIQAITKPLAFVESKNIIVFYSKIDSTPYCNRNTKVLESRLIDVKEGHRKFNLNYLSKVNKIYFLLERCSTFIV